MNKQAVLDAISQVLDSMGMGEPDGDEFDEMGGMGGGSNEVPIWSKLQAGTLGETQGAIHDKSALLGMDRTSKPPTVDLYGMPIDDEGAEMMTALGLV